MATYGVLRVFTVSLANGVPQLLKPLTPLMRRPGHAAFVFEVSLDQEPCLFKHPPEDPVPDVVGNVGVKPPGSCDQGLGVVSVVCL